MLGDEQFPCIVCIVIFLAWIFLFYIFVLMLNPDHQHVQRVDTP
ncbi:hypothetical protein ACINWC323_0131 [Acinetobacter sp. WC-323]|nr:hypothetical protein ACINWC323_0131 [Acinetobacter sp. WC-323]